MITSLAVITATVFGVMVGVEFSVVAFTSPTVLRLPVGAALEALAEGARKGGRVMPFWYLGSLILTVWLTVVKWGGLAGGAGVAAIALLLVSVVMSLIVLVPINNRTATWTADNHPADWREQYLRWDRWHWARVAVIVAAFVLLLITGTVA